MAQQGDIRYLTPINIEITKEKFGSINKMIDVAFDKIKK